MSVLVYVALISSAAPHDSNETSSITEPSNSNITAPAQESIPPTPEQQAEGYDIVRRLAKQFSINYFEKRARYEAESAIVSPLSFFIALSMLSYGAEGAERNLFLSALGLRDNEAQIAKYGYERLINTLSHYNMNVSTKVYYTGDLTPVPAFADLAKNVFKADLEPVSVDDAYISTARVNGWVMNQTDNQCTELFKAPLVIGPNPSIVLVNTVYFKAAWESPFDSSLTTQRPFHIFDTDTVPVSTMHKISRMPYGRLDAMKASFVELPLKTTRPQDPLSMFIILPDQRHFMEAVSVNWIVGELGKFRWENLRNTTMRNVNLYLPKFNAEFSSLSESSFYDYALNPSNPFKTQLALTNIMTPSKSLSFGKHAVKFLFEINEDGGTTTGSSSIYYKKNENESVNRNVRATNEETAIEFNANHTFLAIIAMKGEVFQDVAILNFNGFPFMPRSAVMWGTSFVVDDTDVFDESDPIEKYL